MIRIAISAEAFEAIREGEAGSVPTINRRRRIGYGDRGGPSRHRNRPVPSGATGGCVALRARQA